jgi:hypothetical protein
VVTDRERIVRFGALYHGIPLGYPAESACLGGHRRSTHETTHLDHWGGPV